MGKGEQPGCKSAPRLLHVITCLLGRDLERHGAVSVRGAATGAEVAVEGCDAHGVGDDGEPIAAEGAVVGLDHLDPVVYAEHAAHAGLGIYGDGHGLHAVPDRGGKGLRSFPNKRILRNNLCLPACKNIIFQLGRDTTRLS